MDPRTIVQSPPPRRSARRGPQHTKRGATARLQVMTLNVGHLSSFLWGEIKAQLGSPTCDHDVICLQELHWSQTCQFTVGGWTAVVSAGKDKSDGVMILVNPRYKPAQVKFDEIIKGRVLRVQIAIDDSRVEIFGCYQFVWQSTLTKEDNLRRRQTLLDKLCVNVRAIAKRSTVVVLGDFNAELVPSPGRVGQSLANTPRHVGADAPDPTTLTRALEEMELIALNTWCTRSPHTNYTPTGCSQIDFVWVKDISADATARKCRPADPDVGSWRQMGHKQLTASIRLVKYYHLAKPQARAPGIDTTTLAEHARMHHPNTSLLRGRVQQGLEQLRGKLPAEALSQLNYVLHRATAETYPAHPRKQENRTSDYLPIWKLRDELRRRWRRDAAGLFQAWGAATRLAKVARDARRRNAEWRRDKVQRILQDTQSAAEAHLPHQVYQLVAKLKPWHPRPAPRLKSKTGELLTATGEHERLVEYCREIFAPELPVPEAGPPRLHMTGGDWAGYLAQTKIGKAVPRSCAPAATWKVCSDLLGPYLETITQDVETMGALPADWSSPELIWLTKPNKAPDVPEHLRPIGLLSPVAKAAAASVRDHLLPGIQGLLHAVPQFAYIPERDIYDALARVGSQVHAIRTTLATNASNRFAQRLRRERHGDNGRWLKPITGGAILSVDLHKAFDLLTREQLSLTLSKIDGDSGVKNTALHLHTGCQYKLGREGGATSLVTTRGVRQGCRLAPALWSAVSGDILGQMVSDPFTGPITIFADDHLGAWSFHTMDDILAMERDVLSMFQVLASVGMSVSPSKSKLIVRVTGAAAEKHLAQRTVYVQGQPHWRFGDGADSVTVPMVKEFVYLGTVVSLDKPSDRTLSHRIEEAKKREGQLRKCIRSRSVLRSATRVAIWRACVVSSALYGLLAIELSNANVRELRQWFHKSLRAVTGLPAHLTHISNAQLRQRYGLRDPVHTLLELTRNKLNRLTALQPGHAATLPATLEHWRRCEANLAGHVHTEDLNLTPLPLAVEGVPCPYCGVYFQHTKAMRQRTARKHGVTWREPLQIQYHPEQHAEGGMPECRHCGKKCGSHQGLRFHIMHNACGWHQTQGHSGGAASEDTNRHSQIPRSSGESGPWISTPKLTPPGMESETKAEQGGPRVEKNEYQVGRQLEAHPNQMLDLDAAAHPPPRYNTVWEEFQHVPDATSLRTEDIASRWRDKLMQHCCICNNWALDKGSVKCHLQRMHAQQWYSVATSTAEACKANKHLLIRGAACRFCNKLVYGVERHSLQCPVLFQASFMKCLAQAPAMVTDSWQRLAGLTVESCAQYLGGDRSVEQSLAEPLSRFCVLCSKQGIETPLMDMQAWRKHLQLRHGVGKSVLTTQFSDAAVAHIARPCTYCLLPFQKSSKLHRSKCLPLAQLLSLRHGYAGIGGVTDRGSVGAGLADPAGAQIHTQKPEGGCDEDQTSQIQKAGQGRRQGSTDKPEASGAHGGGGHGATGNCHAVRDPNHPHATDSPRPSAESAGSGSHLRSVLFNNRDGHPEHVEDRDQPLERPVREGDMYDHTPSTSLWMEMEARLVKFEQDPAAIKIMTDSGFFLEAPHRWAYTTWSQQEKKALVTDQPHLSSEELRAALKTLKAAAMTDGVIHRFAPMQKLGEHVTAQTIVFTLVLTTRPKAERVHGEMAKLVNSAALSLIGLRLRPEKLQLSPLAKALAKPRA